MKAMRVYLSEIAFMNLLLSSAEVFKKECLGYLLGYRLEDRFIVEHAFSLQSAARSRRGVAYYRENHKRLQGLLRNFHRLEIIGDFHSHTQYGEAKGLPIPSKEDVRSMKRGHIYLIVAINNGSKSIPWGENRDGTISGSAGEFFFKVSAYYLNGKEPRRARIHCPFPPGL